MTTARERRNSATRAEIIRSFLDLAHQGNSVSISIPAVAAAAGVSARTVYRYFPTKSDLQTEAAKAWGSRVRDETVGQKVTAGNFSGFLKQLWKEFDGDPAAVMAEHASPVGRQMRRDRLELSRSMVNEVLADQVDIDVVDDELVDLAVAITSSSMYLELVDRMGHDPDRAATMAARMAQILLDHIKSETNSEAKETP